MRQTFAGGRQNDGQRKDVLDWLLLPKKCISCGLRNMPRTLLVKLCASSFIMLHRKTRAFGFSALQP